MPHSELPNKSAMAHLFKKKKVENNQVTWIREPMTTINNNIKDEMSHPDYSL